MVSKKISNNNVKESVSKRMISTLTVKLNLLQMIQTLITLSWKTKSTLLKRQESSECWMRRCRILLQKKESLSLKEGRNKVGRPTRKRERITHWICSDQKRIGRSSIWNNWRRILETCEIKSKLWDMGSSVKNIQRGRKEGGDEFVKLLSYSLHIYLISIQMV